MEHVVFQFDPKRQIRTQEVTKMMQILQRISQGTRLQTRKGKPIELPVSESKIASGDVYLVFPAKSSTGEVFQLLPSGYGWRHVQSTGAEGLQRLAYRHMVVCGFVKNPWEKK